MSESGPILPIYTERVAESFVITPELLQEADSISIHPEDRNVDGSLLVAPNGPISNLNEQNWKIVRTRSFKEWFGDWQSETGDASKIVDRNGEPFLVYHETAHDFNSFDDSKIGSSNDTGYYGAGHYFATNKGIPGFYSGQEQIVIRAFLNIRRPYYFDDENPDTLYYKCLLNRAPKSTAIAKAEKYIDLENSRRRLRDLEQGIFEKHQDVPRGVDFAEHWERQRLDAIKKLKALIEKQEGVVAHLSQTYDELNGAHDGVIVQREKGNALSSHSRVEVVAFQGHQVAIIQKEDNRSTHK